MLNTFFFFIRFCVECFFSSQKYIFLTFYLEFFLEKLFGKSVIKPPKNMTIKTIWTCINFDSQNFWPPKILTSSKILPPKRMTPTNFDPPKILTSPSILMSKYFWQQKKFLPRKMLTSKIFWPQPKRNLIPIYFDPTIFDNQKNILKKGPKSIIKKEPKQLKRIKKSTKKYKIYLQKLPHKTTPQNNP